MFYVYCTLQLPNWQHVSRQSSILKNYDMSVLEQLAVCSKYLLARVSAFCCSFVAEIVQRLENRLSVREGSSVNIRRTRCESAVRHLVLL